MTRGGKESLSKLLGFVYLSVRVTIEIWVGMFLILVVFCVVVMGCIVEGWGF